MAPDSSPIRGFGLPLCVAAMSVAALAVLVNGVIGITGEVTFPLDDAYIHLGLARSLVEAGTWGVNPGEFASASSSPAWTGLVAAGLWSSGDGPAVALALNVAALLGIVGLGAALLSAERGVTRFFTLSALCAAVPLPFLAGLGMEHSLHLMLVFALLLAAERARSPRGLLVIAGLGAFAVLTRYETGFFLLGLVAAYGRRGWRGSGAAALGGAAALTGFGAVSLANGAAFFPNPVLKKAWAGRDWIAGLSEAWTEGQAVVGLVVAVTALLAFGLPERERRRAVVFLVAAVGQGLFGRIGWLYRYEAWIMGLGVLVFVPGVAALWRNGPRLVAAWLLSVSAPAVIERSAAAWSAFTPAARSTFDTNVVTARWIATAFPGVPLAVHDLGAMAFYTENPLVDLAGLGTDEVARLHRAGRLTPEAMASLLEARHVRLAVAGPEWMDAARPAGFAEVARIVVPYPAFPGTFDTVVWASDPATATSVGATLRAGEPQWAPRVDVLVPTDLAVTLDSAALTGAALRVEPQGLSFYTNGVATFVLPGAGAVRVSLQGTPAEGRSPRVRVSLRGASTEIEVPEAGVVVGIGTAAAGDRLVVEFADDGTDGLGGDRNVTLRSAYVRREADTPR